MGNYKVVPLDQLVIQGMMVQQRIAAMQENIEEISVDLPTVYSAGLNETLFFSSPREIVSYYFEAAGYIPRVSKFEYIGEMDYMDNVVKEETTDGLINYYSYIDENSYNIFSLNDALDSKIGHWDRVSGNITNLYVELQKRGADIELDSVGLKLVNNK